jgi:hypothetical protein
MGSSRTSNPYSQWLDKGIIPIFISVLNIELGLKRELNVEGEVDLYAEGHAIIFYFFENCNIFSVFTGWMHIEKMGKRE